MKYIKRNSESNIEQKTFEILQNGYIMRYNQSKITNESGDKYICEEYWFDDLNLINEIKSIAETPYDDNGWHSRTCNIRIVAPITMVNLFPQLLFELAVIRKLHIEQLNDFLLIYCNFIEPEHQEIINQSNGTIYIEINQNR